MENLVQMTLTWLVICSEHSAPFVSGPFYERMPSDHAVPGRTAVHNQDIVSSY